MSTNLSQQKREQQVKLKMNFKKTAIFKFPEKMLVKYDKKNIDVKMENRHKISFH